MAAPPSRFVPLSAPELSALPAAVPVSAAYRNSASTMSAPTVLTAPDGRASELGWWVAVTFLLMAATAVAGPTVLVRPRVS